LSSNNLSDVSFLKELTNLFYVNLDDNPITEPPPEIVKQGIEGIRNYYKQIEKIGEENLYEAKLLIVGRGAVGKTCLMEKLVDPDYQVDLNKESTEGVDIRKWPVKIQFKDKEVVFSINFWDFGGQEIYHSTHQFFLTKRSFYLFIWDARQEEDYHAFDYWLNVIKLLSDSSPTLVVMNKSDERIKEIEQANIQKKFPNVKRFYQVSAYTGKGMDELREDIKTYIKDLEHIGDKLPKVWQDIRRDLEKLKKDYIPYSEFIKICFKYSLDEKQAIFLSEYFHILGVFLHFKDEKFLRNIVILRPEWGTTAVYNVLDDKNVRSRKGRFTKDDLNSIWKDYPKDKHDHLLQLMQKFELSFEIGNSNNFIAPELMSADPPEFFFDENESIKFEYDYMFMPAGIITRLIVRLNQIIHKDILWKNGVMLKYDDTLAKVISEPLNRKIKITITGINKVGMLTIIRKEIDYIHETLNHPDVKEMIPCNCEVCINSEIPKLFEFKELRQFKEAGEIEIICNKKRIKRVSVESLIGEIYKEDKIYYRKFEKDVKNLKDFNELHLHINQDQYQNYENKKEIENEIPPTASKIKKIWVVIVAVVVFLAAVAGFTGFNIKELFIKNKQQIENKTNSEKNEKIIEDSLNNQELKTDSMKK